MSRIRKRLLIAATGAAILAGGFGVFVAASSAATEALIEGHIDAVLESARTGTPPAVDDSAMAALPAPVQRYFRFAFRGPPRPLRGVRMRLAGTFRRPGSEAWTTGEAEQYVSVTEPAFVFAATFPLMPGVWARAMDAYAGGQMDMKVRLLSTITVVDAVDEPALNETSLMRYLIESPLFPTTLLPGGAVRWEPIDDDRARAVISRSGVEGRFIVTFAEDGSITRFDAEADGSLDQAFHGSGEHATRSDYREVDGVMIPMRFEIARVIGGEIRPFWRGEVTEIEFDTLERF